MSEITRPDFIPNVDPLVTAKPILRSLGDATRRTLYNKIKAGKFPPPDVPAKKRGEPDMWRLSTAQKGIAEYGQ